MELYETKTFAQWRKTPTKWKDSLLTGQRYLQMIYPVKGLMWKIYQEHIQLNTRKKKKNWLINGQRTWTDICQCRHTDSQKAHENTLNILNHQGNSNQNDNKISPHKFLLTVVKKTRNNNWWWGCGEKVHLCNVGGNVIWGSHYVKHYGDSSRELKIELPCNPSIPLLGIYPKKWKH